MILYTKRSPLQNSSKIEEGVNCDCIAPVEGLGMMVYGLHGLGDQETLMVPWQNIAFVVDKKPNPKPPTTEIVPRPPSKKPPKTSIAKPAGRKRSRQK